MNDANSVNGTNGMNDECLICGAALEYRETEEPMVCQVCGRREGSKTQCVNGHYVCSECHTRGLDAIVGLCLEEDSADPVAVLERMMDLPFCHMHGPEHHVMVGAALLTAYANAGGEVDLAAGLREIMVRGRQVPGGACGYWGACGAGVSTGIFVSVITGSTPLAGEAWGLSNLMTSASLAAIGANGGPRCCKRDSYLALRTAVDFVAEHLGVQMEKGDVVCSRAEKNNQCRGAACPFSPERESAGGKD